MCGRRILACQRPGRPSRAPRSHPYAREATALADLLAELPEPLPDLARKAVDDELTLLLPTVGDGPLPSPELGREPPSGKASLASWRVPALVFDAPAAAELLAVFSTTNEPHPDLAAGATIIYLGAVARFAADLAARGLVLPALIEAEEEDGYAARWRPVLAAADAPALPGGRRGARGDRAGEHARRLR